MWTSSAGRSSAGSIASLAQPRTATSTLCRFLIRKMFISALILHPGRGGIWWTQQAPRARLHQQGRPGLRLCRRRPAARRRRSSARMRSASRWKTSWQVRPACESCTTVVGYNLISAVHEYLQRLLLHHAQAVGRTVHVGQRQDRKRQGHFHHAQRESCGRLPECEGFAFPPPPIPGIGTAGGATFILQDRSGGTVDFLQNNMDKFIAAAKKRPGDRAIADAPSTPTSPSASSTSTRSARSSKASSFRTFTRPSRPSWAARSSTTSTASGANGRSTSRRKGPSARGRIISASFTCATTRAKPCR